MNATFRRVRRLGACRVLVFTLAVGIGVVALYGAAPASASASGAAVPHPAPTTRAAGPSSGVVLVSARAATAVTAGSSGTGGLPGIQVGPSNGGGSTPTTPASGSGGTVSGGSSSSAGLFDITGHIEDAIDDWFRDLVTTALTPVLTLIAGTLLATPDVTSNSDISSLWQLVQGIADGCLVLFVLVGGAIVMGYETVQTRTAAKDIIPRIIVAGIAINASLSLASLAINTADSLFGAILGTNSTAQTATALSHLILGALTGGGIFVVILGGVVAVLAVVLLAAFAIRLALVTLLIVAAPIFLMCHALPQTEGLAKLWWRAFGGTLLVQIAQSLVLVTAVRVFLGSGGAANLGISSTGNVVDLLVSVCVCWVMIKIPSWVSHMVFTGGRSGSGAVTRVVRDVVVYRGAKALAAGALP